MSKDKITETPMVNNPNLRLKDGTSDADEKEFRQAVGCLKYLSLTRPNLAFSVNKLAQFMYAPTQVHWVALKRLLRFLKGKIYHGLFLYKKYSLILKAYNDSDQASDLDERNTTCYILYLSRNPVAQKQKIITRSFTVAEYKAVANTTAEILWFKNLLMVLGVQLNYTPVLLCDNIGAKYLSANHVFHSKMKHLALDYFFVCQHIQFKDFKMQYVITAYQLADGMIKSLAKQRFLHLRDNKLVANGTNVLHGHIKTHLTTHEQLKFRVKIS